MCAEGNTESCQQDIDLNWPGMGQVSKLKLNSKVAQITLISRPAGLPAKSSEEELRHQRQHQKLVEEARRKEQEDNRSSEFYGIISF